MYGPPWVRKVRLPKEEKAFEGYQINAELMKLAKPDAMVQHCLPAHRGEEITADVFEAHADEIFDEAENRLHAQKSSIGYFNEIIKKRYSNQLYLFLLRCNQQL